MKLDIHRVKFSDSLRALVVVNEDDKILAGGVFRDKADAITAGGLLETLIARINNPELPPFASFDDFQAAFELEERDTCDFCTPQGTCDFFNLPPLPHKFVADENPA